MSVQYLDTYQPTEKLTHHVTDLSLLHFNSRSLKKNGSRAKIELDHLQWKFPVIAVTETWTTEEDTNTIFFPGYSTILKSRSYDHHGGVGLFLNDEFISGYEIKSFSSDDHLMETLFGQVFLGGRALIIGVLYKPPNIDLSLFNSTFDTPLSRLNAERKPCYLLGDFNVKLRKADNHRGTEEFVNLLYADS